MYWYVHITSINMQVKLVKLRLYITLNSSKAQNYLHLKPECIEHIHPIFSKQLILCYWLYYLQLQNFLTMLIARYCPSISS
jgi:hypothetical protein